MDDLERKYRCLHGSIKNLVWMLTPELEEEWESPTKETVLSAFQRLSVLPEPPHDVYHIPDGDIVLEWQYRDEDKTIVQEFIRDGERMISREGKQTVFEPI